MIVNHSTSHSLFVAELKKTEQTSQLLDSESVAIQLSLLLASVATAQLMMPVYMSACTKQTVS
jgi:hypothetical protein